MSGTHSSDARGGSSRRAAITGALAAGASLVVVLVVAMLAGGSTADPGRVSSRPIDPNTLLDLTLAVMVIYSVVVVVLLVVGLFSERSKGQSEPGPKWASMILGMFLMGGILWLAFRHRREPTEVVLDPVDIVFEPPPTTEAVPVEHVPMSGWVWLVAFGLVALAGAAVWWVLRGTHLTPPGVLDAEEERRATQRSLADLLDTAIDDLRDHPDPRQAVLATFARLEEGLEAVGVRRERADTPLRYLERVLRHVEVSAPAVERLTEAYEEAHYSSHHISREAQLAAVEALVQVRDELRGMSRRLLRTMAGDPS